MVAAALLVLLTHNLVFAIYPMIGGFMGLAITNRIRPDLEALKNDPEAFRKPRK